MKEQMIQGVTEMLIATARRIDLEHQRLPKPEEFAVDIVNYFYELAKEGNEEDDNVFLSGEDKNDGRLEE